MCLALHAVLPAGSWLRWPPHSMLAFTITFTTLLLVFVQWSDLLRCHDQSSCKVRSGVVQLVC